jgi:hypothetical protein
VIEKGRRRLGFLHLRDASDGMLGFACASEAAPLRTAETDCSRSKKSWSATRVATSVRQHLPVSARLR